MSPNKLATELLQFRASTSLMVPGVLTAAIGGEAVQDAFNRGWIQPDHDTGFLRLSEQASKIQEMEAFAEAKEESPKQQESKQDPNSRGIALRHAGRLNETYGIGMGATTSGSMGSGQPERPATPEPRTPMETPPNRPGQDYMVGEDVVIADEGKSYQAKVAAKNQDGTYKLTFGPNRPVTQDRAFRREEMQRVDPRGTTTVPVSRP